ESSQVALGAPVGSVARASIVIPAHNEEAVIARCLTALLDGANPGELEILVVCNGCTDRTAEIAGGFGEAVQVLHCPVASKIAALNYGDQRANAFPRFYVDADVVMTIDALRKTVAVLSSGTYLAASPAIDWDLSRSSWAVRAFYAVWRKHPYFDSGRLGSGLYALSAAGHERLKEFPQLTADDEYVRQLFDDSERTTLADCRFLVTPPRGLADLIKIKTRSRRGNLELERLQPVRAKAQRPSRGRFLGRLVCAPWLWPALPVYFYVVWQTSVRARQTLAKGNPQWERDLSSRPSAEPAAPRRSPDE
ncbi:MAG: glycosyltransferase, partial [Planctomycetota bacterium]|nr:glycosyltransferase [Planctomycetota bacterium]